MSEVRTVLHGELVTPDRHRPSYDLALEVRAAFLARYPIATTRASYAITINQWYQWCHEHGIDPMEAKRGHVELFARTLEAHGRKASTVAGKLHTLRGLYRFALADEMIAKDPMVHVRCPTIERTSTSNALTRPEFHDVLNKAKEAGPVDHAVITLLGLSGLRVSSVCGIDIEHLSSHEGAMTVTVRLKGGKYRTFALAIPTAWAVSLVVGERTTGPLFVNTAGNRMDRRSVDRIVQRHVKACGITKRITPHSFRHTFITLARNAGVTDRDIIASPGHADARMVTYYDRAQEDLSRGATHSVAAYVNGAA